MWLHFVHLDGTEGRDCPLCGAERETENWKDNIWVAERDKVWLCNCLWKVCPRAGALPWFSRQCFGKEIEAPQGTGGDSVLVAELQELGLCSGLLISGAGGHRARSPRGVYGCFEPSCKNPEEQSGICDGLLEELQWLRGFQHPLQSRGIAWGKDLPGKWGLVIEHPMGTLDFITPNRLTVVVILREVRQGIPTLIQRWERGEASWVYRAYMLSRSLLFLNREELLPQVSWNFLWYIFFLKMTEVSVL